MLVLFERSGGFAGVPVTITIDLATLSPADATQLNRLIEQADFFNLPTTTPASTKPDRFQYRVTIQMGDRHHTIKTGEATAPETLTPLLDWLTNFAQKQR
jgi:hypothetical protein